MRDAPASRPSRTWQLKQPVRDQRKGKQKCWFKILNSARHLFNPSAREAEATQGNPVSNKTNKQKLSSLSPFLKVAMGNIMMVVCIQDLNVTDSAESLTGQEPDGNVLDTSGSSLLCEFS